MEEQGDITQGRLPQETGVGEGENKTTYFSTATAASS